MFFFLSLLYKFKQMPIVSDASLATCFLWSNTENLFRKQKHRRITEGSEKKKHTAKYTMHTLTFLDYLNLLCCLTWDALHTISLQMLLLLLFLLLLLVFISIVHHIRAILYEKHLVPWRCCCQTLKFDYVIYSISDGFSSPVCNFYRSYVQSLALARPNARQCFPVPIQRSTDHIYLFNARFSCFRISRSHTHTYISSRV